MTETLNPSTITAILVIISGVLGLMVGSFSNVLAYRVPAGISLVHPPSRCPACNHDIRHTDNIPVLGWLLLKGKCRHCAAPISPVYPIGEAATGLLFAITTWWAITHAQPDAILGFDPVLLALLPILIVAPALITIDIRVYRLPDPLTLPLYPLAALGLIAAGIASGTSVGEWPWATALLSMGAWWLLFAAAFVLSPLFLGKAGMGMGDVKLAPVLGLVLGWVGWSESIVGLWSGFLIGGIFSLALMARKKGGKGTAIPYGPFLLAGAWLGLLAGGPIGGWYTSLFGL